jgi:hypothetical protein
MLKMKCNVRIKDLEAPLLTAKFNNLTFIGLGLEFITLGDTAVIFFGSIPPFILRETGSDGSSEHGHQAYQLVGECYIPRLMKGGLWRCAEMENSNPSYFVLI